MGYDKSDLAELFDVIVNYLQDNPNAADSLEGIMKCWLPQAYQQIDRAIIEQILEQLIDAGQVRKIIMTDGTALYRLGKSRN